MERIELIFIFAFFLQCTDNLATGSSKKMNESNMESEQHVLDTITLGAGCFWCVEAIFEQLEGVEKVVSGYSGGHVKNPSYREVCNGTTGHAEVCQLSYDPNVIVVQDILEVFWQTHDPTTLNRQGADVGTQYRSEIFYHNEAQKKIAGELKSKLNKEGVWADPIVTEITPYKTFYEADDYHQEYYRNNQEAPYCRAVIQPKLEKFKKVFSEKLKE